MRSLEIREVTEENEEDVTTFLKKVGKKPQDFPFFKEDPQNNSLLTATLYENNKGVACGHLETRNKIAWLKIISTKAKEEEFSYLMIKYFLEESEKMKIDEIRLSIVKSQESIIKIYEDFDFKKHSEKGKKILLRRIKNEHSSNRLQQL